MCPPDWELALGTKVAAGALGGASGGKQDTFKAESCWQLRLQSAEAVVTEAERKRCCPPPHPWSSCITTQAVPTVLGSRGGAACGGERTGASWSHVDPGEGFGQGLSISKSRFP